MNDLKKESRGSNFHLPLINENKFEISLANSLVPENIIRLFPKTSGKSYENPISCDKFAQTDDLPDDLKVKEQLSRENEKNILLEGEIKNLASRNELLIKRPEDTECLRRQLADKTWCVKILENNLDDKTKRIKELNSKLRMIFVKNM